MSVALALPTTTGDRRLGLAIAVSLLLHALILSLHFTFPDASQAVREKALDIILVNARSKNAPAEAQAQALCDQLAEKYSDCDVDVQVVGVVVHGADALMLAVAQPGTNPLFDGLEGVGAGLLAGPEADD